MGPASMWRRLLAVVQRLCGCAPPAREEQHGRLRRRSWGAAPEEHTLERYKSNWCAWCAWNEKAKVQCHEKVVTADALANLPQNMTAFRVLLSAFFPELASSETQARKAVRHGCVLLDAEPVKWDTPLPKPGQVLTLRPLPWYGAQSRESAPLRLHRRVHPEKGINDEKIFLLAEPVKSDLGIYFVHKPSGMESQPWSNAIGKEDLTFEELLPCVLPCPAVVLSEDLAWLPYPKVAHRLDLRVSGIVAVATTRPALQHLKTCFEGQRARKTYRAIVAGDLREHPLWKARKEGPMVLESPIAGRPARTEVTVMHVCPSLPYGGLTSVNLRPVTGRQHQLREHLARLGFPIIGDSEHWQLASEPWRQRCGGALPSMVPAHGPLYLQALSLEMPLPDDSVAIVTIPEAVKFARLRRKSQSHWKFDGEGSISAAEGRARRHDTKDGCIISVEEGSF